jgi:predicted AAA+ superfamily ATPase
MEVWKHLANSGPKRELFYWRDSNRNEVDLLIATPAGMVPVEIKAGRTFDKSLLRGVKAWRAASGQADGRAFLVYNGEPACAQGVQLLNYADLSPLLAAIGTRTADS